jgi:hypothetical protein
MTPRSSSPRHPEPAEPRSGLPRRAERGVRISKCATRGTGHVFRSLRSFAHTHPPASLRMTGECHFSQHWRARHSLAQDDGCWRMLFPQPRRYRRYLAQPCSGHCSDRAVVRLAMEAEAVVCGGSAHDGACVYRGSSCPSRRDGGTGATGLPGAIRRFAGS